MSYAMVALMLALLIIYEWCRYFWDIPPSPRVFTALGTISVFFCAWRVLSIKKKLVHLRLGRDGEKTVGQMLESLREHGAKVLHDLPGGTFNLDHVIISPTGIFAVETKTRSKPADGQGKLYFDGTHVTLANGYRSDEAVIQAQAAARWLRELIKETTGKLFNVQPAVVFPGWYVETEPEAKNTGVWVLNPKALPSFIANNREQVSPEDVALITSSLSAYIRNHRRD